MTEKQGAPYFVCDSCGVRSDDPVVEGRVKQSEGNAHVALEITNIVTGEFVHHPYEHICSGCWCRVQAALEGREVPARPARPSLAIAPTGDPFRQQSCTCDVPLLRGTPCPVHPVPAPWHGEMS